jgi:hypothetical protein
MKHPLFCPQGRWCSAIILSAFGVSAAAVAAGGLQDLDIFNDGWPHAFFFRQSESIARAGRMPFEDWEQMFLRLDGIMGKTLDEELPGTQERNTPIFVRFKQQHPKQTVLLHFNGDARDPRWECGGFFAGHWLYQTGCRVISDVPAQPGECELRVADPRLFRVNMGRFSDKNDDLCLCAIGPDGKPDWNQSEQLELLSIDRAAQTLRVRRGAFGTVPRTFAARKAYLAAHVVEGPWAKNAHLLWLYNYSTHCPRDTRGRNCVDALVEDLAPRFLPGGALSSLDGLEFDVLMFSPYGGGNHQVDADGDGKTDGAVFDGINTYGLGVFEFCRRLREKLGPDKIIMADGHSELHQRSFGILNGIESEGWPDLSDAGIADWSGGLNRHEFWRLNAFKPALNYTNHKFVERGTKPGEILKMTPIPLSISRLVMAAGMFTDSTFTYCIPPAGGKDVGVYDELWMGAAHRRQWLGKPLAPPVRLALRAPDLFQGNGQRWPGRFVSRLRADSATLATADDGRTLRICGERPDAGTVGFTVPAVTLPEGDVLLHLRIKAEPMKGYPAAVPRVAWVGWLRSGNLMRPRPLATGMTLRQQQDAPLDRGTGAAVRFEPLADVAGGKHKAYFVHPPYLGAVGSTFWETSAAIPADKPRLEFFSALSDRARAVSDGVVLKIEVRGDGKTEEVATFTHTERQWVARSADLSRWAGQTVRLRFTTDPGPRDNATADQTYWGDLQIVSGSGATTPARSLPLTPARMMTWANNKWFDAYFYFRDLGPDTVDFTFEFEGGEMVYLADLTAHAATDAIARDYEHGVVLANPNTRPFTFDVSALFPGAKLRRLQGSPDQDPATNDGSAAGPSVTVGPRDALFLEKERSQNDPKQ